MQTIIRINNQSFCMKKITSILNFKRILCFCFFIGISICFSFSEVVKFRAHAFAFREKDEDTDEWKSWSDWQEDKSLIVINDDVMNIYGKHEERFDVIEEEDQFDDEQDGHNSPFICVDSDGVKCRFVLRWTNEKIVHFYYKYSNLQYVYEVDVVQ